MMQKVFCLQARTGKQVNVLAFQTATDHLDTVSTMQLATVTWKASECAYILNGKSVT